MNQENKNLQNINNNIRPGDNYYNESNNHSLIELNDNSIGEKIRNAEPQDNIKKSKRRRLLEMEKNLKLKINQNNGGNNSKNYEIKNNFDDNNDNKSLTEIKTNRINSIFKREINPKDTNSNESNTIHTKNSNNNIKIEKKYNIYNNKEKLSKMTYQNNNLNNIL